MPSGMYGEINLKEDFFARGDGVSDDTSAFNAAVADCIQNNGGNIYIPPGIYIISSSIVMTNANNISIRGAGATCTQIVRASGFVGATFGSLSGIVRCHDITLPDSVINGSNTAPGIPSSTVALTNPFPFRCLVYVNGGTVTVIAIGGTTTGQIAGAFILNPGQTITLTYSVVPTSWTWFGIDG